MSNKVPLSTLETVQLKHESIEEEDDEEQQEEQPPPKQRRNMPTLAGDSSGSGVPAFLAKLWRLVDDPDTNNLICWSKDGRSFIIQNQAQFARELLPLNYKHNNMASFIRQLNMYGFHKITSIENGGLRFDRDEIEFSHPCFKRNFPYLLDHIKRKISNNKNVEEKSVIKQETVSKVLSDVKAMRGRQDNLDSRFSIMKQENEALWREIASLRQKHAKQQQIVNKLIQFLISMVQPSRNMSGVKRHIQLMINDTPENARLRTTSETESENGGPVIHELSEELLDEVMNPQSPFGKLTPTRQYDHESTSPVTLERPRSNISVSSHNYDYSNQSGEDLLSMAGLSAGVNLLKGAASPASSTMNRSPYTVTEAPEVTHVQESPNSPYNEDLNVLTTPMVREQEARNRQLLKEQNKQRRRVADQEVAASSESTAKSLRSRVKSKGSANAVPKPLQVKIEPEATVYAPSNYSNSPDDVEQISPNANMIGMMEPGVSDLYDVNFISNDMPTDIFEGASLLSDGGASDTDAATKLNQQQQFGRSTVNSGKFSNNPLNFDLASTSSAAVASDGVSFLSDANLTSTSKAAVTGKSGGNDEDEQNLAVAKYTRDNDMDGHLRDVSGHIDTVQDELDTLKDLLRGEGVSIDQNMLMGAVQRGAELTGASRIAALAPILQLTDEEILLKLFNESELMDNYGLSFPTDSMSSDKKTSGSELMAYQPSMYDLSDILDSDDNNKDQNAANSSTRQLQTQTSTLNTPRHYM